jgi:hypothetical protein
MSVIRPCATPTRPVIQHHEPNRRPRPCAVFYRQQRLTVFSRAWKTDLFRASLVHRVSVLQYYPFLQLLRSRTLSIVSYMSKMSSCLYFKTQCFGDWILSPSSGKTYSVGSNRQSLSPSPYACHFQDGVYKPKQHNSSATAKKAF